MTSIVKVENIIKKYSRNSNTHLDYGIKDLFTELRGLNQSTDLRKDEFYAVNDVSFTLKKGQSIALIGRNGCGKTTLLKMIAGLIKPTDGRITIDGKIQALIALGAGFENKLSGRENIYNSASLIGLGYNETIKIIDEIIEFSEIEEFIDSPVETYSSGMYARLGFSVAIHLKPEVLLVDEILSVGDYAFQNKCFMKMHQLKKEGMSIILVSHSHTQVTQLCDLAVWMERGNIVEFGKSKDVVTKYLNHMDDLAVKKIEQPKPKAPKKESTKLYGSIYPEFDRLNNFSFKLMDENGNEINSCKTNDSVFVEYSFDLCQDVEDLNASINFYRKDGLLMTTISTLNGDVIKNIKNGKVNCKLRINNLALNPCEYVIVMPIHEGHGYLYRDVVKELLVTKNSEMMHWGILSLSYEYEGI